jgi:hypothetical protein
MAPDPVRWILRRYNVGNAMKANPSDWYKHGWSLDIKNMSWVEDTENQVDFIVKALSLIGSEKNPRPCMRIRPPRTVIRTSRI